MVEIPTCEIELLTPSTGRFIVRNWALSARQLHLSSSPRKRGPSRLQGQKAQILRQVAPAEIVLLDQFDLPCAEPLLDPLLAQDRLLHRRVLFEPDEPPDPVLAREAGNRAVAVLLDALDQAGGDAGIDRAIAPVGEQIDRGLELALLHRKSLLGSRFRGNDEVGR